MNVVFAILPHFLSCRNNYLLQRIQNCTTALQNDPREYKAVQGLL